MAVSRYRTLSFSLVICFSHPSFTLVGWSSLYSSCRAEHSMSPGNSFSLWLMLLLLISTVLYDRCFAGDGMLTSVLDLTCMFIVCWVCFCLGGCWACDGGVVGRTASSLGWSVLEDGDWRELAFVLRRFLSFLAFFLRCFFRLFLAWESSSLELLVSPCPPPPQIDMSGLSLLISSGTL